MQMTFGRMSEPLTKVQQVDSSATAKSYDLVYKYEDESHPTVPTQIGYEHYTYDANGNPIRVVNDSTNTTREMFWDEENRLMVLSDNGKTSRYTYNAGGERIVKSHGTMEGVYINGTPQGITFHETDDYTIYPASILTVNKNRFTKHYFLGDKRVDSRIGIGRFNNVYGINGSHVTAGQQDYAARMGQIEAQREEYYKELGIAPGVPTMKGAYGDPENTGVGYNTIIKELGDHSVPQGWIQTPKTNQQQGSEPGAPISWDYPSTPDNPQPGYGYIANDTTREETYYFHSDHLGSTSYITDDKGNITQYDAYLPYGELLVDEHSSSEELPYKFNGKELDEETGLYYYGARFFDPRISLWMGTDPMLEKYPSISAYAYTNGNPIAFVDIMVLYPEHLLQLQKTSWWESSYYRFTPVAVHLLSLFSGVDKNKIAKTKVYERSVLNPYPWYFSKKTYAAITLPEGNGYAITFTNNLFDDSNLGQNYYAWLNIASHEVGHINHIDESNKSADEDYQLLLDASMYSKDPVIIPRSGYRIISYTGKFAGSYIKSGSHDSSPLEKQAEIGSTEFKNFNNFVSGRYGKNSLLNLVNSKKADKDKIIQINIWWNEYVKEKKQNK